MDALVLAIVNASTPALIDAETLAAALREREEIDRWLGQLSAFFTEVPLTAIEAFADAHQLPLDTLRRAYEWVRSRTGERSPDVEDWLGSLEGAAP